MTREPNSLDAVLARLGNRDPFSHALWQAMTWSTPKAVRSRFVIELVAHPHDSLTDSLVTEPEAYQTFVRTVSMLNASSPREAAMTDEHDRPPIRYIDAERINPFRVLLDLHDHATRRPAAPRPDDVLAELALAAAVVSWWSRWQPMSIHAALRAGADLADIAAATGLDPAEVIRRWQRWTDIQTRLVIGGRPAVDADEVRAVHRRLAAGVGA